MHYFSFSWCLNCRKNDYMLSKIWTTFIG